MKDEITVTIKDASGRTYSKDWRATANRTDAIRWTLEMHDIANHLDTSNITGVTIT